MYLHFFKQVSPFTPIQYHNVLYTTNRTLLVYVDILFFYVLSQQNVILSAFFIRKLFSLFVFLYEKNSFSNDSVGRKRFFEHTYLILLEAAVNRYILSDNIANGLILTRDFLTAPKGREPNYRMENPDSSMIGISSSSSCCTSIKPLGTRRASFACSTALTSPCS